jgi:predicted ABC-type ATPase
LLAHQTCDSFSHGLSAEQTSKLKSPRCIIIAGPNGAGKTTFAREFLPKEAGIVHFVNADLLAAGLSPLRPEVAALAAGKLLLKELDRLSRSRVNFAFESTLSGLTYISRLRRWKAAGYRIEIVFLKLHSPELALRRIAARVRQGGHNVKRTDVLRRFDRSWRNFQNIYKLLADAWKVYENSSGTLQLLEAKR